jgi:hypothetical protein
VSQRGRLAISIPARRRIRCGSLLFFDLSHKDIDDQVDEAIEVLEVSGERHGQVFVGFRRVSPPRRLSRSVRSLRMRSTDDGLSSRTPFERRRHSMRPQSLYLRTVSAAQGTRRAISAVVSE